MTKPYVCIAWVSNPFDPVNPERSFAPVGATIRDCVIRMCGEQEFDTPTICILNGDPVLREDWDSPLTGNDMVVFVTTPGMTLPVWAYWVIAGVLAVGIYLSIPKIGTQDTPDVDSAVSLTGQRNRNRIGQPIECSYGRTRIYPSLAALSYNQYINNDQFQFSLYSLGHGKHEVLRDDVFIEDTPITDFPEIEFSFIPAGETVNIFRNNVVTPVAVRNKELLTEDKTDVKYRGLTGLVASLLNRRTYGVAPVDVLFPVSNALDDTTLNPWFTVGSGIDRIEVDLEFPSGISYSNDKGGLSEHYVRVSFRYQLLEEDDDPIGTPVVFVDRVFTDNSNEPKRYTLGVDVPSGRYSVQGARLSSQRVSSRYMDKAYWTQVRGFGENTETYPVDVMAVKAKATNGLNDQAATRLNIWNTRKLPTWDLNTEEWSEEVATRSKVWAFVDVWKSTYGAALEDEYLDLQALYELDKVYQDRNEFFDWIFDQKITVWEAARQILGSGRAVPILNGSKISAMRDSAKSTPVMVFGDSNIKEGSFSIDISFTKLNDPDGLEVEYLDQESFLPNTLLCLVGEGDQGDRPSTERLVGITDPTHAYREGLYRRSRTRTEKTRVSFTTGRQGYLLRYGELISIAKEMPVWGSSGSVVDIDPTGRTLVLSDAHGIPEDNSKVYLMRLNRKDGTTTEAFQVTAGPTARTVLVSDNFNPITLPDFNLGPQFEPPAYVLGEQDYFEALAVVDSLEPSDLDNVGVSAYIYQSEPHSFDNEIPSVDVGAPPTSTQPILTFEGPIFVTQSTANVSEVTLSWLSVRGARYYLVQSSTDGRDWSDSKVIFGTSYMTTVRPGAWLSWRVSAVNAYPSAWVTTELAVYGVSFIAEMEDLDENLLTGDEGQILKAPVVSAPATDTALNNVLKEVSDEFRNIAESLRGGVQYEVSDSFDYWAQELETDLTDTVLP